MESGGLSFGGGRPQAMVLRYSTSTDLRRKHQAETQHGALYPIAHNIIDLGPRSKNMALSKQPLRTNY